MQNLLFQYCWEASFQELADMPPVDLDFAEPEGTENQARRRRLEKLRRLCALMVRLEVAEDREECLPLHDKCLSPDDGQRWEVK